ncbi:FxSxx-COOH system tetratricopeptide repeat protein [Nonomuraea sp. NPDC050202]|uniref:FxSxx-COOH system tetratricopeptide repeat protein n=1 Tax=Nonomuraea sp. NPDC050202 TaxID=3155035 RepID=UPI0033FFE3B5
MDVPPAPRSGEPEQQQPVQMKAAASDHGRVYQAGHNQTFYRTVLPEAALRPVTEVAAPPGLVNLPRHTSVFVGRDVELTDLAAALRGGGEVVLAAVHGLGGIGKSTLAARYARAQIATRNPVWWITADTAGGLQAGLAALTTALQPELTTAPLPLLAERATAWLAAHDGWLLVLDNVADPADVRPLLERIPAGQVLITTRLGEGWHRLGAQVLRLDVLDEREAIELLTRIALPAGPLADAGPPEDVDGAAELVRELGCLPLAIEQAAAYLHQTRLTPRAYLELLRDRPAVMYHRTARGSDAERTIARIWRITLDRLAEVPLAGQALRVAAWYSAEPIPRGLLEGDGETAPDVQDALGHLAAYNMITLDDEHVTVHRLVQAVARTPDPEDPHRQATDLDTARGLATVLLAEVVPESGKDPDDWPIWRALLPHITALADHTSPDTDSTFTAFLLNATGLFLGDQGAVFDAIDCLERAAEAFERLEGADHLAALTCRNNLAGAYESAGRLDRAAVLYDSTLAACERVLDAGHPLTLTSRNNLAGAYLLTGRLERAVALYETTLAASEQVLGADHPDTLTTRNNVAYVHQMTGDLGRAIPLHEATLADRERILGLDHPDTLQSRTNLAGAYRMAGDLNRAISLFEAILADRERILGADHPDTLNSRNNLAGALAEAGELSRAIPMLEAILADRERVLGADHPDTLISRNNLAGAYAEAGDLSRAIPLFQTTLADRERILGADRPETLTSRNNLAHTYQTAGDLGRAISLFEDTWAARERVQGADHPETLISLNNLAHACAAAGDSGRAASLYATALPRCERVLGVDHPLTTVVRGGLASLR